MDSPILKFGKSLSSGMIGVGQIFGVKKCKIQLGNYVYPDETISNMLKYIFLFHLSGIGNILLILLHSKRQKLK